MPFRHVVSYFIALLICAVPASASITIGAGGELSLGGGAVELGGGDLVVDGRLDLGSGLAGGVGSMLNQGEIIGGSAQMMIGGDWNNQGSFNPGSSQINLSADLSGSASILGQTTFASLAMTTSTGARFALESEIEQRVTDTLTILGSPNAPIQIESSNAPVVAFLDLASAGTQIIDNVGVSNVYATGQPLAPDQTNQGGTGNDLGWFGSDFSLVPVPTLSRMGLLLMISILLLLAVRHRG